MCSLASARVPRGRRQGRGVTDTTSVTQDGAPAVRSSSAAAARRLTPRGLGRDQLAPRTDPDAGEMEPIRVPAGADRGVGRDEAVRVVDERRRKALEPSVVEDEHALFAQLLRERRRASAVLGIERVGAASRVVEQPEAEDDRPIDVAEPGCEREAGRGDAAPVVVAVQGRVVTPRAREHGIDEVGQRPGFHSVTIARWAAVWGDAAHASGVPRRRRAIVRTASPSSRPCRTSQHPTTVPVRPIPPQQWT